MQLSKEFIEVSRRIANHYQVPTRVVIDEAGLHVEIGGSAPIEDLTRVKLVDPLEQSR